MPSPTSTHRSDPADDRRQTARQWKPWHLAWVAVAFSCTAAAQGVAPPVPPAAAAPASGVRTERIMLHSPALEGNLQGNAATRDVWVVLPPSYASQPQRRYPVVYALHGYSATPQKWFANDLLAERIGKAYAAGAREMIVVVPNGHTVFDGSMYSSSVTTGDWEKYIVQDLVRYIDGHYRTRPTRDSRGLMGHSMGGYGTLRLGMKYPEVFSSLYAMSACCLSARSMSAEQGARIAAITTMEQVQASSFGVKATFATAAAWSPNPGKPPFFADMPYENGQVVPRVLAEWAANAPLAMLPQYIGNMRQYRAIAVDIGDRDGLIGDNRALHQLLTRFGIAHDFDIYDGDHGSGVATRFEKNVIPHFSRTLQF